MNYNLDKTVIIVVGLIFIILGFTNADMSLLQTVQMSSLHVDGRWIRDEAGNVITFYGINKHGFEDHPNGHWQTSSGGSPEWNTFNPSTVADNLDAMKSWGLNTIRAYSCAQFWIQDTENHRQTIETLATMLEDRGMYLIYSMWRVRPTGDQIRMPFPPYLTSSGDTAIIPNENAFADMWGSIADALKDNPNVILEFWNEPACSNQADWHRVWQKCIDAVRSTGAKNLISIHWGYSIWMNIKYGNGLTLDYVENYPFTDPEGNIFYSPHNYRSDFHSTEPRVNCWEYADLERGMEMCKVDYVLNTLEIPVIIGEFGANLWESGTELQHEHDYYANLIQVCNDWQIGFIPFLWFHTGFKYIHLTTGPNFQPNSVGDVLIAGLSGTPEPPPPEPPPEPTTGSLKVMCYYNASPVSATAYYFAPNGSQSHSVTVGVTGYTWENLQPGTYSVNASSTYGSDVSSASVSAGYTTTCQISFGGAPPPEIELEPPSNETFPIIPADWQNIEDVQKTVNIPYIAIGCFIVAVGIGLYKKKSAFI